MMTNLTMTVQQMDADLRQAVQHRHNGVGLQAHRDSCIQGVGRHGILMHSLWPAHRL